ncbi:MAG: glycosyltransferase family 39 protein [Coleofasciculus sp. G3-WIS-01]|uniref:glycosyltransferase family 39 protein n=1 Tax=Coleofasciculus sp. G3-WIS-01 TaxID=3069528 RepID=UPI0032FDDDC9
MQYKQSQPKSTNNKHWQLIVIVVLVLGIFFRFANLDKKPYWGDEADSLNWISGCTSSELIQVALLQGAEMTVKEVENYQQPCPEKSLIDTIKAVAEVPAHPPLYYLMARLWMQLFNGTTTARSLSALISLLAFPGIYWLCLELFESPLVGWITMMLVAISPFHILYAQEVRQYSLWTVMILLSSWTLLRAMRVSNKFNWGIYTLTLVLGLYTHLIFVMVAIAQGIYVVIHESVRFTKTVISYFLASFAGFILFLPWIFVLIADSKGVGSQSPGWSNNPTPITSLIQTWLVNNSHIFIDLNDSFNYQYIWIYVLVLILVLYSIYFLCRNTHKRAWLFVCILIAIPALFLVLPDLLLGGRRSTPLRYFIPSALGIQIAVGYLLATKINPAMNFKNWHHKLWQLATVAIISSGVFSGVFISQSDTWWTKGREYYHPEVAKIVNSTDQPLVIAAWFDMRTLSHSLAPYVVLQDIRLRQDINSVGNGFSDVFVYQSQSTLDYLFDKNHNYQIKKIYNWKRQTTPVNTTQTKLWQLTRNK